MYAATLGELPRSSDSSILAEARQCLWTERAVGLGFGNVTRLGGPGILISVAVCGAYLRRHLLQVSFDHLNRRLKLQTLSCVGSAGG